MSENNTTYSDYWNAVAAMVESVKDEVRAGNDVGDAIHAEVDGCWWVIYTHAALAALNHSKNEDALFEEGFDLSDSDSFSDAITKMAFWAIYADVRDELGDWEPEDDDADGEGDDAGEEDDDADTVRVPSKVSALAVEFHAVIVRHNLDGLIANWIAAQPEGEDTARHLWKSVDTDAHEDWSHGNYRLSALPAHPNDDGGWVCFGVALAPNAEEDDAGEE